MISGFNVRAVEGGFLVSWVETGSLGEDEPREVAVTTLLDLNALVEDLLRKMRTV